MMRTTNLLLRYGEVYPLVLSFEKMRDNSRLALDSGTAESTYAEVHRWREYVQEKNISERDRGMAYGALGEVLLMAGMASDAEPCFQYGIELVSSPVDVITVLWGYAAYVHSTKKIKCGEYVAGRLERIIESGMDEVRGFETYVYASLAKVYSAIGQPSLALRVAENGVRYAERCHITKGMAELYTVLSNEYVSSGDLVKARVAIENAMVHMKGRHCLIEARAIHGSIAATMGDIETAISSLKLAVELPDLRNRRVLSKVLRSIFTVGKMDPEVAMKLGLALADKIDDDLILSVV